jgi:predicted amidohydrolase YtcJ
MAPDRQPACAVSGRGSDHLDGTRQRRLGRSGRPRGGGNRRDHGGQPAPRSGLAVAGGKVAFVGDAASAPKRLRPGGRLIALEPGQAVIPGLVDAHVHLLDAGVMRQRCTLDEATTKARALEIIDAYSKQHPRSQLEWIIGSGWALSLFDERGPTAAELDAVVADRPAVFYGQDGHSAWLNSRALEAAHITVCGAIPRGRIECTVAGTPSGTLREDAVDLVGDVSARRASSS